MTQQTFSFDIDSAANAEPAPVPMNTRFAARQSIERLRPRMLDQVLEFVAGRGDRGATDEEIAAALGMRESTARARRVDLRDAGQVRDSGRRRRSCAGRLCVIWAATGKPLD